MHSQSLKENLKKKLKSNKVIVLQRFDIQQLECLEYG